VYLFRVCGGGLYFILEMITAMAFVKQDDIMRVFEELREMLPEELDPVADWFEKYYIGKI